MKTFQTILTIASLAIVATPASLSARSVSATSPDGQIVVDITDNNGVSFSLSHGGKELLRPSLIALDVQGVPSQAKIKNSSLKRNVKETIKAPFHHTPVINAEWNDLTVRLSNGENLTFRIFNDGVAYRFSTDSKKPQTVASETAEYALAGDPTLYIAHSTNPDNPMAMAFQNFYSVTPASSASPLLAFLPVVADYGNGLKLSLMESDVEAYPGMFVTADSVSNTLSARFAAYPAKTDYYPWRKQEYVTERENFIAKTPGKMNFPWRILAVTTDDRQMPVNNLVYTLASPSRVADTSWIKPGQSAWEWWNDWGLRNVPFKAGINNDTYKYFIDFAANNDIEYVVLDEGWYDPKSGDMLTTIPEIDLPMLIDYANKKGVGLWLWTVFNVLDSQLEEACKKYSDMGIKGFKVDFLDRNDQTAAEMTYRIADATAKNNLMLDLHGFYPPTGLNRTYPNIVNFESVFGMEEMKWSDPSVDMPEYDVTFPFIRMMTGPVDFTPGAMLNASKADWKAIYSSPMSQGTRCHQIANYIVQDSPFTMLADAPSNYIDNQECTDFITAIPTVFESTRILDGKMGEYIVTLRETPDAWYVAGQTDWNPRDYTLDFSFLGDAAASAPGRSYAVTLFRDGENAEKQGRDYAIDNFNANASTTKTIHLAPGGGFALKIAK
ncbi:MAG: glycoside hydrolase family 97 protein [Muribaculaceae bacterium]|nr:glycoside hydrolase family 97 protein [Muribaculaceae bacterium]